MNDVGLRIVKLGGSLLARPDWVAALTRWQETRLPMQTLIIVGGGIAADAVRTFDRSQNLEAQQSHELAIEAMGLSLQMASAALRRTEVISAIPSAATTEATTQLLDVRPFLRTAEPEAAGMCLPRDWSATSDSIAARVADVIAAEELVLLKSTLPRADSTWEQVAEQGIVDEHFPLAVKSVPIAYCVDLTDPGFTIFKPHR